MGDAGLTGGKSSLILMEVTPATEEGLSPEKTRPRWIVPEHMLPDMWPKYRGSRPGGQMRGSAGLCHWCCPPGLHPYRTFGTGRVDEETLVGLVRKHFDLRPAGIIRELDLRRPIYKQTAAYGHFGRSDLNLPWRKLTRRSFFVRVPVCNQ